MNELLALIERFAASRRTHGGYFLGDCGGGLETAKGAYCMCDSTSSAFITFARGAGYTGKLARYDFDFIDNPERNPDPTLYSKGTHDSEPFQKASWHAIVETEHFLLDFTARQYHSDACYPHIINHAVAGIPKFGLYVDPDDVHAEKIKAAAAAGG